MANKVILCADSTCDLGPELVERYHVNYYPFHVILEDKTYGDGVDLIPDQIYQVYEEKKVLPKTAAINTAEYVEFFKQWTDKGYEVVHVTLGSGLSATYNNCRLAAEELPASMPLTHGTCPPDPATLSSRRRSGSPPVCPLNRSPRRCRP